MHARRVENSICGIEYAIQILWVWLFSVPNAVHSEAPNAPAIRPNTRASMPWKILKGRLRGELFNTIQILLALSFTGEGMHGNPTVD